MSMADGHAALINRVIDQAGTTDVVLPEGEASGLPRYVIEEAGGLQRTDGVYGGTVCRPEIVVRVETEKSRGTSQSKTLVDNLVSMFLPGQIFDGVKIVDAPLPRPPLPNSSVRSVPVVVRGDFIFGGNT